MISASFRKEEKRTGVAGATIQDVSKGPLKGPGGKDKWPRCSVKKDEKLLRGEVDSKESDWPIRTS